jgi:hypothetical protein
MEGSDCILCALSLLDDEHPITATAIAALIATTSAALLYALMLSGLNIIRFQIKRGFE